MDGFFFEIVIILLLILANGLLALSEIAVVSSRTIRLQQRAAAGNRGAGVALQLAGDPGRFLSTVQIGITLVGIFTGAFGGATLAGPLAAFLNQFDPIARYSGPLAIAIVVVTITYLSLIFGELVPKQIALKQPRAGCFGSRLANGHSLSPDLPARAAAQRFDSFGAPYTRPRRA
jgi:putative hemolysin